MQQQFEADLSVEQRTRLAKLCGLLASNHDGERAAAALKASNLLERHGLTWAELLNSPGTPWLNSAAPSDRPPGRGSIDWQADLAMCKRQSYWLTFSESKFLQEITVQRRLVDATQMAALADIARRLRRRLSWL